MATAIPQALIQRDQWVVWQYELEGKRVSNATVGATKVPYNARTRHKASSTNPNTWAAYAVAVHAAKQHGFAGVGYVFSADDPYTGIDLDDCIVDGMLEPWAVEIIDEMQSYTEISPSGSGVKIWVEGKIPNAITPTPVPGTGGKIEMYAKDRYFTVTGEQLDNTPSAIRNVNGALTQLYNHFKRPEPAAPTPQPRAITTGDEHAQQWARKVLARAIEMVALAPDGTKHDTLLAAARLAAGAQPHVSEWEIETALFAAIEGRAADKHGAQKTIRDGIRMGASAPLPVPEPPPQPHYDADGFACCPAHGRRLAPAKNGNGYKCRERDTSTASGWCDFWWKGDGYLPPRTALERTEAVTGEVIQVPEGRLQFPLYRMGDLRNIPPVQWLIPNELPASLFTVLCGASESGKSFQAVDYALRTARLHPDRLVVYVAPEGGSGYLKRCEAWIAHHGGEQPENLAFILRSVPMLDQMAVATFIAAIRSFKPVLVILDTMARCLVGGDENSAKDVGVFIEGCDEIRRQTGAAVLVVHHTGKSGNYRGSSALFGACDSWIDFANDDGLITLSCGKAKDWHPFEPRYLRMVSRADSVVLLPAEQVSQRGTTLTEGQRKVLETLALEVFRGPGAKSTQIMGSTGIPEKTLFRILSRLKRDGMVDQGRRGDPYTITSHGLQAIREYHRALKESRTDNTTVTHTSDTDAVLSTTVTQLSNSPDSTVTLSPHPLKGVGVTVSSDSRNTAEHASGFRGVEGFEESELFPEDPPPSTEPLPNILPPAVPAGELNWEYLRKLWALKDVASIGVHCALSKANVDMVIDQLEREGL